MNLSDFDPRKLLHLAPGQLRWSDKLQPQANLDARNQALSDVYSHDPELARRVVSTSFPHPRHREWTLDELRQQLQLAQATRKIASEYLMRAFPNLGAAFSAYAASKAVRDAQAREQFARSYPGLAQTTSGRVQMGDGGFESGYG